MVNSAECVQVTIVIPAYNEGKAIEKVLGDVRKAMERTSYSYEVIVVDDGSTDDTAELAQREGARVIRHAGNRGSGAAVKTGIRASRSEWVAMIDADGTYPAEALPDLLPHLESYPQVVGARTVEKGTHRFVRTLVKEIIRRLASFLAGKPIPDLNSGLKAFHKSKVLPFLHLFPDGFSCVSSMTLAFLTNGMDVKFVPITYHVRIGRSKFHPVADTYRYGLTVIRIVTYFAPLNVFMPLCLLMVGAGLLKGVIDFFWTSTLQESDIILLVVGMGMGALGILADLIVVQGKRGRE
jgi:polyisoprenyl-phosphate glycosyltransferase